MQASAGVCLTRRRQHKELSLTDLLQHIQLTILAYACEQEYSDVGTTYVDFEEDVPIKTALQNTCTLWQRLARRPGVQLLRTAALCVIPQ